MTLSQREKEHQLEHAATTTPTSSSSSWSLNCRSRSEKKPAMGMIQEPGWSSSPRHQMGPACRLSSSNKTFRGVAVAAAPNRPPLMIQKVPQSVRDSLEERYFVPEVVSIGPYHHRTTPELVEMEQVKEAVAHQFCRSALRDADDEMAVPRILEAIRPILPHARSCYDGTTVEAIDGGDFAYMMVVDGCFLLAVMSILTRNYPEHLEHSSWTHGRMLRIMKDILLFENQIPWPVMRGLLELWPAPAAAAVVDQFVAMVLAYFDIDVVSTDNWRRRLAADRPDTPWHNLSPSPAHLLDLVHQRHLGLGLAGCPAPPQPEGAVRYCDYARPFAPFTSAVELAEAGIELRGSWTCRVKDVRVAEEPRLLRLGHLVLPQLALSWLPRCWLINMVALECVTDRCDDRSGVSSYLAILGSLVRGERDVEELRARRILFSTMSDRRTVEFFEGLLDPLPRQELYLRTLEDIVRLRSKRSTRSGFHRVYYRNRRFILAAAPLLTLLVTIVGIVVNNSIKHK